MSLWCSVVLVQVLITSARALIFFEDAAQPQLPLGVNLMPLIFEPPQVKQLEEQSTVVMEVWSIESFEHHVVLALTSNPQVAHVTTEPLSFETYNNTHFKASFNITGLFLGYSYVYLQAIAHFNIEVNMTVLQQSSNAAVSVIRKPRIIDKAFIVSVAVLVSLIYINFGCALDWSVVRATLKRPIGPAIGFVSQFGFMPVISFLLGRALFPGQTAMQLGMFFTGCSPGGGASNIWTVAMGGNLDLSITMTTISTFAAFAMIPLWVFTLGRVIFEEGNLGVPYVQISRVAAGLLIPLLIGTLIQHFLPKVARWMVRVMKPFALFLIVFIVVFGTVTNLYIFVLFDWKILVGGLCVPWLGYIFGALFARALRQSGRDMIAIAVETGVQNTGISIFLLRFVLEQPEADLAQICPVAVSLMTPLPLALFSLLLRLWRWRKEHQKQGVQRLPSMELASPTLEHFSNMPADKY